MTLAGYFSATPCPPAHPTESGGDRTDDKGLGLSPEQRDMVFEPFVRLEESRSRSTGGAGLGLAIAAELVRAHGGEIRLVEGTIGATLRLTIPDRAVELSAHRGARAHG